MLIRFLRGPLLSPAGDDGGGGGNGGSGSGNGDGGDGSDGDQPRMSAADVGKIVNGAVKDHLKRLNIDGRIEEKLGEFGKAMRSDLAGMLEELKTPASGGDGEDGDGKNGGGKDLSPEVQKQLQKLNDALEAETQARVAAEKNAQEAKTEAQFNAARTRLGEALQKVAHPDLHDVWVDQLVFKKRLRLNDDSGEPELEVEHTPYPGAVPTREFLPLEEAVPKLFEEEESKRFLAPSSGPDESNGSRAPRTGRHDPKLDSKDPLDRAAARLRTMGLSMEEEFGA